MTNPIAALSGQTHHLIELAKKTLTTNFLFGMETTTEALLIAFLSRGHVLIEGPPGTGKTTTAKLLAWILAKNFKRIQFTTDMLPSDIIGSNIYQPGTNTFNFIPGPLFSDFIVADEINRTPPRTQSALLEAMEERQVTVEGKTHPLSRDFFVVATQNPQDFEGTFALPEVQLDRFLFKLVLEHPIEADEKQILTKILEGVLPPRFEEIPKLPFDRAQIDQEIRSVQVSPSIISYMTKILNATRQHPLLSTGSSSRGGIALIHSARVLALIQGRNFVTVDDIKLLCPYTLTHRVKLNPEAQISGISELQVISEILEKTEFPK